MQLAEYLTDRSREARERFARRARVSLPTIDAALDGRPPKAIRVARAISRATGGAVSVAEVLGLSKDEART